MYVPHELFNRIDYEYICREHIQCTIYGLQLNLDKAPTNVELNIMSGCE